MGMNTNSDGFIASFALVAAALPCFLAKDVCYTTLYYEYYCIDGYACCNENTICCKSDTSSPPTTTDLPVVAAVGIGIGCLLVLYLLTVAIIFISAYCIKKWKSRNSVSVTEDHCN